MRFIFGLLWILGVGILSGFTAEDASAPLTLPGEPFVYTDWESFTTESTQGGLPNDHIFSLKADGDRLWVGTEGGLALLENGKWKHWTEKDGLPWNVITGITVDPKTHDVWLALFGGGLARFSGGRFDHFHQLNSGLVNDVVYGVAIEGNNVWAATTAGTSRYDTVTGEWEIFTEKNAPMEEIWCYNVTACDGKVYVAAWGGGVLEWDVANRVWKDYRDPDHEMEIDLFRDDGLIHIITTAVSYVDRILWVSTYFGVCRYDGRHWRGWTEVDSGLISAFTNFLKARSGNECYFCTDKGLGAIMDFPSDVWVVYRKEKEEDKTWSAHISVGKKEFKTVPTNLDLPNHFVISTEMQNNDVWVGTGKGLARGKGKGYWPGLKNAK